MRLPAIRESRIILAVDDADDLHFVWDADKASANVRLHGVSFETATNVFDDPNRLESDDEFAQGEYRTIAIGRTETFLLAVVYAEPEEGLYRIISARLATPTECKDYENDLLHP